MSKKKKIEEYFIYGYVSEHIDMEFPAFQFSTKSIDKVIDFVKSVDFELIDLQVVRYFSDHSTNFINLEMLKELCDEIQ